MSSEALKEFYANRKKELLGKKGRGGIGIYYIYDKEGNLVTRNKEGAIQQTVTLPSYRPLSLEEVAIMEKERQDRITAATKAYDEAFEMLHNEYQRKDRSLQKVMEWNRQMVEADHHLQHARFPARYIVHEEGVEIRRIDFHQPAETRKLPYSLACLRVNPFPLQEMYVREGNPVAERAVEASASALAPAKPVLFIQDAATNEYGFMALDWPVQIRLRSVTYHSAKQALAAELAKTFGDDEGFRRVMDAESPADVSYTMEQATEEKKEATPETWAANTKRFLYEIQQAKFDQYPELRGRLLSTGDAVLAVYQPGDELLGIGIPTDDVHAKNPIYWKGQNLLGSVLMEIRGKYREAQDTQEAQEAKSSAPAVVPKKKFAVRRPVINAPIPVEKVQVIGTIFKKPGEYGDFEWQIKSGQYEDSLFIFNDSEDYHATSKAGKGNAIIRKYNKYSGLERPRSAGINTGKSIKGGGYTQLDEKTKRSIDSCIEEARAIIKQYGYKRVFYSADVNGKLGTSLFVVSPDVIEYITQQILLLAN
jgi:ribA/ribD-fused uncharacterized protein